MPLLLQVIGADWKIEIIGKLPDLPPFIPVSPQFAIEADGAVSIEVLDAKTGKMRAVVRGDLIEPLFFEAVAYDVHFEKSDPAAILKLPPGAEARRVREDSEHHLLNFGNNVGFVDLFVASNSGAAKLRLEVFSRKADYRTDYVQMRSEVSSMLRNLAMAANAKTYGMAAPARDHYPTLVEWFSLLRSHFGEFIKLTSAIAKKPHSGLAIKGVLKDTERARRVSRQAIGRALRRDNGGAAVPSLGIALPRRIQESVASITFDTPENRYYKALISATYRNIRALSKVDESGDEDADRYSERKFFDSIRPVLKSMERQLETASKAPFLGQVKDVMLVQPQSMVFHKHPLYSKFDKLCRLLNGGLSFAGETIPIGVKDTSLLYEYWCFLKIVALLRARFDLVNQSVVKVNRLRTTVALSKGKSSAMKFVHKPTGKPLFLVYNRLFSRLPTIAQKPDNVIQFASDTQFYIFDAKYRIQFDRDYMAQYGGPGPTTDDVNTMHRYRDAIAIPHPMHPEEYLQGVVTGAVVLFPYPDEEAFRSHRFYKSIGQVEIGGLPFLPGSTTLVAEKIDALLDSLGYSISSGMEMEAPI
ncbi:DUF2357 domain-containing protein [Pseudomonas viridiflava]|uniref:DUF2357 domain-containing protein n=1 Tax=Pseudomonas viridiflava TaxID=33069 RepID=UPI000F01D20C|nr:DUF2357 domain-containing protein [Pseudomonas viridiflava]